MFASADHALPRVSPEEAGIASPAIARFVEALDREMRELHSFMLLRHGKVVAEAWWSPYGRDDPHLVFSVSKSFTSTAVGFAAMEGLFAIDDPVISFFPDETPAGASDFLAAMTVRHLLTMTTGHEVDTLQYQIEEPHGNWIRAFLQVPVLYAPGTHFLYNTGATYMLAAIVQKTTGMKLIDYLRPRLFEPLGIQDASWQESPQAIAIGAYGLSLKTEDLARFGQLYLQRGMWNGQQILPEAWIEAATSAQVSGSSPDGPSDWTQGYGYQFWRCRHGAYQASGVFGQCCIVMPEQEAVFAFTGGIDVFEVQSLLDLVWQDLLPAIGHEPLPAEAVAQDTLMKKLSALTLAPVDGADTSPLVPNISGRTYAIEPNELGIEAIRLDFDRSDWKVRFTSQAREEILPCGYHLWRHGHMALFNGRWVTDAATPVVASGAWTSDLCFTMVVRLYETPFFQTLVCHFLDDEMLLETWVNITIDVPKKLLLTARSTAPGVQKSP